MSRQFLQRLASYGNKSAIVDWKSSYSYSRLVQSSTSFAENQIKPRLAASSAPTGESQKVAFLTEKDATYALSQLSTW